MNAFVSTPPAPASPAASVVESDGWYPGIDANAMRDALRIGTIVTHPRLVAAIEGAMISAMRELSAWRVAREGDGFASLEAVDPATINGTARLVILWTRTVRCLAAAELAELHRDITATADGATRADADLTTAEDYRRMGTHALRDMLGVTRTAVELI